MIVSDALVALDRGGNFCQMLQQARGIRSAEKTRTSSCLLSDQIAHLCISTFRHTCPRDLHFEQTCLSGIVGLYSPVSGNDKHQLEVISLGCGTKTLAHDRLLKEREEIRAGGAGTLIRDFHAEVLARRGFKRWLLEECYLVASGRDSRFVISRGGKFALKRGWTFHLYASSQPCGNASVKRWAKGKRVLSVDLPPYALPPRKHKEIYFSAIKDGEIALTVKKCSRFSADVAAPKGGDVEVGIVEEEVLGECLGKDEAHVSLKKDKNYDKNTDEVDVLSSAVSYPGRAPFPDGVPPGISMSCSDKILMWNTVGLQGCLLFEMMSPDSRDTVKLSSIIIGRKYSEPHGMRALCCRGEFLLQNELRKRMRKKRENNAHKGKERNVEWGQLLNHPAILCTSVKLDEGSIFTSAETETEKDNEADIDTKRSKSQGDEGLVGAQFKEYRSLVVYRSGKIHDLHTKDTFHVEILHSRSGLTAHGTESAVSGTQLRLLAEQIREYVCDWPDEEKSGTSAKEIYAAKKAEMKALLGHEEFGQWRGLRGDDW